ncbi:hypothetical protein I4U23_025852 [Adineta vaga]|nr:hypothetical protein I4U23_025852 [Adineta vaga]
MKYFIILFVELSFLSIYDTTILWRINVNPPAYLFGTVHLPQPIIWPSLSNTVKSAFENSTDFLPEFDVTNFFSFTRVRMCLQSHMASMGNGPPSRPPPGMMNQRGPQAPLLDVYLAMEARRRGKNVDSLETADIYCEFTKFQMDSLSKNNPANTGQPPFPNENSHEEAKRIYNCDLNYPGELLAPSTAEISDKALLVFKQRLEEIVDRRDRQMSEKINNLLENATPEKRYFFAVGFIHLMSPTGLVAKLRQNYNYSITRLCTDPLQFRTSLRCPAPSWCDTIAGL